MTVTVASFRNDFPQVFGSQSDYPDQVISYWLAMAALMLGTGSGSPPSVASFTGSIVGNTLDITEINFGSLSLLPLLLQGLDLPANAVILEQLTVPPTDIGTYKVN